MAAGSQLSAALEPVLLAALFWPPSAPSAAAWLMVAVLALLCSGVAYVLYFRLIADVGPANAIAVTFLIPVFAAVWVWVFLGEGSTLAMLLGCVVILVGTGLMTGLLKPPARA